MKPSKSACLFALALTFLLVAGCGPQVPSASQVDPNKPPANPAVLVIATEGSPPTFDPISAGDSRVDTPSLNLYNALTQVKYGTTEIENDLAESYQLATDGLSYTFNL